MTGLLIAAALAASAGPPQLFHLRVSNGSTPFAGDRALLTTVSPNGDGFRDRAIVSFRLTRSARVRMDVVATELVSAGKTGTSVVSSITHSYAAGPGRIVWSPARDTQPRTYILRL